MTRIQLIEAILADMKAKQSPNSTEDVEKKYKGFLNRQNKSELEKILAARTEADATNTDTEEDNTMANTKTTTTKTTTTTTKTQNNGWEKIAKRNLKNAYNWRVGEIWNAVQDGDMTEEQFNNWIQTEALDDIYHEAITTLYTGDSCGGEAPKEMRFAGKDFCYKYLISLFKKDNYTVTVPEEEPKKTKAAKTTKTTKTTTKTTKTTKKAANTEVTVLLRTFTGLKIGIYTGKLNNKTHTITIHIGRVGDVEFNLDGTQKTLNPSKNPKFNNKIEIMTEE